MTLAGTEAGKLVTFDAADGSVIVDGLISKIGRSLRASELPSDLAALVNSRRDLGNGWTWMALSGTVLDDNPCTLLLGFFHGHLAEVSWSVRVAGADYTGGWPSPDAVAKEMDLVSGILAQAFGRGQLPGRGAGESARYGKDFPWGRVWCESDPRAGTCASGLRYACPQPSWSA